ncbi:type I polyketide synthase [Nocardia blacklockiae]|uniref:type I polyketide synthase n=1 Tax=Nocardia blacklockiae TaxID=480036 RepID=UPI0018961FD6|nr:type I polyketide synthase [Nocardia blacklockiae]MBF6169902.1 thioester reductase domain-containing protein [Nocardia blacklockiae]
MTSTDDNGATGVPDREATLRRALLEVRTAREEAARARNTLSEPIAVIGVGCRFPGGVAGVEDYWNLLVHGRSGIVDTPRDRWDVDAFFDADPDVPGRTYSRHGGFLSDVRGFDASVFGIPPREAISIDPQHRLVLEVAWEALEHAAIAPDSLRGSQTGVFVGMGGGDYERLGAAAHGVESIDAYVATGNAANFGANRLSYVLGLEGPSLVVDTACSSSLVALHLAAQSLRAGECELALAGGVNTLLSPEVTVALSKGRMLSPSGQCRTFDADADGYVRGEGCGVVVLRTLSSALAAGDDVLCVIRGSAVNQDGRTSGLTVPRGSAQRAVVRRALAAARVTPAEIGYVEAHGTGTPLGDPIEVRALATELGPQRPADRPLRLGSVKTNIGHLEAAAGIAGFIKAALVVARGTIPPHLNLRAPNPHVPWDELPVEIPRTPTDWGDGPRIAGVSSFGFGGTNAHVIVAAPTEPAATARPALARAATVSERNAADEPRTVRATFPGVRQDVSAETRPVLASAPDSSRANGPGVPDRAAHDEARAVVVKVSAASAETLTDAARRLADYAEAQPERTVAEIAWTAGVGRADLNHRAAVVADSREELVAGLREVASGSGLRGRRAPGALPRVAMIAPGHGARIAGCLAGIYGVQPVVTEVIDALGTPARLPLSVLVESGPAAEAALLRTEVAQPALYALAVALGQWWRSVGVEPDVVTGHSVGAYAAAALAGVFSVADGAALIDARARAMSELAADGAMAAVRCPLAELEALPQVRSGAVTVAVRNGVADSVLSGPADEVAAVVADLGARQVRAKLLPVTHAFHSPLVDPMLDELRKAFVGIELSPPALDFVSDSTGAPETDRLTDPEYWVTHTRNPVRFDAAVAALAGHGVATVIELGPGGLLPLVLHHPEVSDVLCVASTAVERPDRALADAVARVWTTGSEIRWRATGSRPSRRAQLPTYPLRRTPYWIPEASGPRPAAPLAVAATPPGDGALTPLVMRTATGGAISQTRVSAAGIPFLDEHVVHDIRVVPGVVMVELALRTAEAAAERPLLAEGVSIVHPLVAADDVELEVQVLVTVTDDAAYTAEIFSRATEAAAWTRHATITFAPRETRDAEPYTAAEVFLEQPRVVNGAEFYDEIWHPRFVLGRSFRLVEHAQIGAGAALAAIGRPAADAGSETAGVRTELVVFDACVQLVAAAWAHEHGTDADRPVLLGTGFERMRVFRDTVDDRLTCTVTLTASSPTGATGDIEIYAADELAVAFTGVSFAPVTGAMLERLAHADRLSQQGSGRLAKVPAPDLAALRTADRVVTHETVLGYVVAILAAVLGCEPADIDTLAMFNELVDSLMMAELKQKIERDLEVAVPLEALFDHPTPRRLSDWLVSEIASEQAESERGEEAPKRSTMGIRIRRKTVAEMTELAALDPDITPGSAAAGERPEVLLTGGTGFVGAFVLRELLDRHERVHCLVRAEDTEHARRRITENLASYGLACGPEDLTNLTPVVADLAKPFAGLEAADYDRLSERVGQIVHAGALVKWTYPFRGLEAVNIGGTRELLRLATWGAPIPFHFLSTVGVFSSREYLRDSVSEDEPLDNSGSLVVGYAQTKWIAERMVRTAAERGLPTTIHRINTAGHSVTGAFNKLDHLSMMVKGCIEAGIAPLRAEMPIQPAPVDYVARAIAACTTTEQLLGQTFHLVSPQPMTWPEFFDTLDDFGYDLQRLPFDQWRERILRRGSSSMALLGLMPFLSDSVDHVRLPLSESDRSAAALSAAGIDCPPLNADQLGVYLRRFVDSGFVQPPGEAPTLRRKAG